MAYVAYDQNKQSEQDSTNVLGTPSQGNSTPTNQTSSQPPQSSYVSNGNPYGKYGGVQGSQPSQASAPQSRKASSGASSGQHTNVQSYIDKNQQSSQDLSKAASNQLQTTGDIAKKNLQSVQNKFTQGLEAGSLENRQGAVQEAQTAFKQAASATGPEKQWNSNEAALYAPEKNAEGGYSAEDQALISSNKARVRYGDGSYKDFDTAADASDDVTAYNKENPGYYTYGEDKALDTSNDRLSKILNAEYQGPNELNEISGYGDAYNKFQDASALQNQVLKGADNSQLLNRTFASPNTEYNTGAKLLDNLLLGQGAANEKLRATAQSLGSSPTGKLTDDFSAGVKDSRTQAAARSQELNTVKQDARKALMDTSSERTKEVDDRINNVIKDWDKYPQHFRDRFKGELESHNKNTELHKQYTNVANKYQGGYEGAIAQKQQIQQNIPNLDNFNISNLQNAYSELSGVDQQLTNRNTDITLLPQLKEKKQQLEMQLAEQAKTLAGIINNPPPIAGAGWLPEELRKRGANLQDPSSVFETFRSFPAYFMPHLDQAQNYYKNQKTAVDQDLAAMDQTKEFKDYDPNALSVNLSQLESEALGVQGGEGLYNLLKDVGVDGLIKTAKYDRNQLIGTDEQSQLSRLESLARLAKDYGVKGSGVNLVNRYSDRDAAGQQNATSALDMDNFTNLLQSGERSFRTDAAASNITGSGYGTGSSRGIAGKKKAQAWSNVSQNLGDLIKQGGGYRNMYENTGVNKDLLRQASDAAKGVQTSQMGFTDGGLVGGVTDAAKGVTDSLNKVLGSAGVSNVPAASLLTNFTLGAPAALAGVLGSALGGSKAAAQGAANSAAHANAIANLQQNIINKINATGLKNQLGVKQNSKQDEELFKLLGLLDTTNL